VHAFDFLLTLFDVASHIAANVAKFPEGADFWCNG